MRWIAFIGICLGITFAQADEGRGRLLISFDDRNFQDWEETMPLFAKYNARVTFFVNGKIDERAIAFMKLAKANGHSLGLHGLGHLQAPKAVREMGGLRYEQEELLPQIRAAREVGFEIQNFACPYSSWDKQCAESWQKYFTRVRSGHLHRRDPDKQPLEACDQAFTQMEPFVKELVKPAVGFGDCSVTTLKELEKALDRVKSRNEALLVIAHRIRKDPRPGDVSQTYLEGLLAAAKARGISMVGYDEVKGH